MSVDRRPQLPKDKTPAFGHNLRVLEVKLQLSIAHGQSSSDGYGLSGILHLS